MADDAIMADASNEDAAIQAFYERRGGNQQQLHIARAHYSAPPASEQVFYQSELAAELGLDWAMGLIKSPQVWRFAAAAAADMGQTPFRNLELQTLAKIGTGGLEHCYRNLKKCYDLDAAHMPEPILLRLPLWDAKATPKPKVVPHLIVTDINKKL